jgi:hypothetical protein
MIANYKLGKSFGPVASITGIILFVTGVIVVWFYGTAIILILLGALLGFTFSSNEIDFVNKKVRNSDVVFGFIKTGRWLAIKSDMKIGILHSKRTWRTFSSGNRELESPEEDYRLVLFTSAGKKRIPLKKCISADKAAKDLAEWCRLLKISKY